ncbi:hypothetical protein [Brevibacillus laterosporus]|uniref:hypothetical protein n=1 Tax=Brevibacillus laterosporus TaxID=1465 RepID=UPI001F0D5F67|nr:hypothetical protein [Brevibacillus laterosporus]WNX33221.1 hypothetical protein RWW94_10680 [Brevibacillus laterosporus]
MLFSKHLHGILNCPIVIKTAGHLQGQWAFYNQMGMKDKAVRIGQLADELRVASGQIRQNQ